MNIVTEHACAPNLRQGGGRGIDEQVAQLAHTGNDRGPTLDPTLRHEYSRPAGVAGSWFAGPARRGEDLIAAGLLLLAGHVDLDELDRSVLVG